MYIDVLHTVYMSFKGLKFQFLTLVVLDFIGVVYILVHGTPSFSGPHFFFSKLWVKKKNYRSVQSIGD